jgi:hypothetical protein
MKLIELIEGRNRAPLSIELHKTMPPTFIMPSLQNNDSYMQYRYIVALASAKAIENGDVQMDQLSTWNQNQTVVCYAPEEAEIVKLANKHMNVEAEMITNTPSCEPDFVFHNSPVRQFKDYKE